MVNVNHRDKYRGRK